MYQILFFKKLILMLNLKMTSSDTIMSNIELPSYYYVYHFFYINLYINHNLIKSVLTTSYILIIYSLEDWIKLL